MKLITADSNGSVEEIQRSLKKISVTVRELLKLQLQTEDQLAVHAAGLFLEIQPPKIKNSPAVDQSNSDHIKIASMDKLRKNYKVLRELFSTKTELDAMELKLRTAFGDKSPQKAIDEISKLKKDVSEGITNAFSFLSDLAKAHLPSVLDNFSKGLSSALAKSLLYKDGRTFTYAFEDNGDLCFTVYHNLTEVEDDRGRIFPELFLTATYRSGNSPQMYVGIQHHFTPPSSDLMMKKVKSLKDALVSYNHLMELDEISNTLGNLPVEVLLKPGSVVRNMFSYKEHVKSIETNEHEIVFHLRTSALQELDKISAGIFRELNGIQRSKNAKLRMSIRKAKTGPTISFRFVMPVNAPPIDPSDLEFLKDRFHIDDATLLKVVRVINIGD